MTKYNFIIILTYDFLKVKRDYIKNFPFEWGIKATS